MSAVPGADLLPPRNPEPAEEAAEGTAHDATWPTTMLVSALFVAALAGALAVPLIAAGPSLTEVVLFAPALALGVIATRWTFGGQPAREPGRLRVLVVAPASVAATVGTLGTVLSAAALGMGIPPISSVLIAITVSALVLVGAAAARALELRYLYASRRVFLVARQEQLRDVVRECRRAGGITVVGTFDLRSPVPADTDIAARLTATQATMLVLSSGAAADVHICEAASQFNLEGGRVRDLNRFYERHFRKVPLSELSPSWFLLEIAEVHRPLLYRLAKRSLETLISGLLLVLLSPLLSLVALVVRASSHGPVFYRQPRMGLNDRPFTLVKFRTMREAPPDAGADWAGAHADRVTQVGAMLRRWRLDEVPQLWNVVLGHMSLVGPRPEQVALVRRLEQEIPYYRARHCVRPGLTGWAQVNHGYGGSDTGTIEKLQYDFFYLRHQGFRLDALTLVMTGRAVFRGLE